MSQFTLSANAATAFATFGVILHTGAHARREFCIAFVGECIEQGASVDDVATAMKSAVDYDNMEDAERALLRKQVQYCRAIVGGWKSLGEANRRAFCMGSLPASSAVKLLKAKDAPKADAPKAKDAPKADADADAPKADAPSGAEVISPVEMGVRFAAWLDAVDVANVTVTEAKAIAEVAAALDAFRAKVAATAKQPKLAKAA